MKTPPPQHSPELFLSPLPAAPRRQASEKPLSPSDDFENNVGPSIQIENQKGLSWLANYPRDPLRALCFHYNVNKPSRLAGNYLPRTIDLEVFKDNHLPTHVLALTKYSSPTTSPLMIPIQAGPWQKKMAVHLPPATPGSVPPDPHWDATRSQPTRVITLPVISANVPHPDNVPILLLFALGLEPLPNMLAMCLLPVDVLGEFPDAREMANVMARDHEWEEVSGYAEQNRQMWENTLSLGVQDAVTRNIVHKAWRVAHAARETQGSCSVS